MANDNNGKISVQLFAWVVGGLVGIFLLVFGGVFSYGLHAIERSEDRMELRMNQRIERLDLKYKEDICDIKTDLRDIRNLLREMNGK